MILRTPSIVFGLMAGILALAPQVRAGSPPVLSGGIYGQVKGGTGVAQMGATVLLFNRYDQLVQRALTNEQGKFAFDRLTPDLYSIRVSLASFVPALRRNIAVAAGSENLLQINLANLFSTVDLISSGPSRGTLMSDDWKWVLRSSQATRPVLRFLPVSSSSNNPSGSIFSDTTGLVRLSAGDGESFTSTSQEDLGTAFALATSVFGTSRVQFAGNIGYIGNSAMPATGFRTKYVGNPDGGTGPEVTLTVHQLYLPNRTSDAALPLRTASLAMRDLLNLTDDLHLEYGLSMESVTLLDTVTKASPFARITYDLAKNGSLRVAYSGGTPPPEFVSHNSSTVSNNVESDGLETNEALSQDLDALALLPRISRRDDHVQVQRTQNAEVGYQLIDGKRTYSVSVYSENVTNGAFTMSGPEGFVASSDSLPDLGSNSRIFDIGSYHRLGYTAAVNQSFGSHVDAVLAFGRTGALTTNGLAASSASADDLRALIQQVNRPWVSVGASGTLPLTGTFVMTTYGWTDSQVLMPDHVYLTENIDQSTGWNIRIRQPLPVFSGRGGRLEATGELRNMLAQGYLPIDAAGRKALLTNSPRSVRGGLAFIF